MADGTMSATGITRANRDGEWTIGEGIFLLALGAVGIVFALLGEGPATFVLPFLLLLRAVDEFVSSFEGEPFGGVWHVVLAGTSMLAAVVLLGEPGPVGPVSPALFPGGYFLVDGAFRVAAALRMRHKQRWALMLVVGAVSIGLGIIGLGQLGTDRALACGMVGLASLLSGVAVTSRGIVFRRRAQQFALQR